MRSRFQGTTIIVSMSAALWLVALAHGAADGSAAVELAVTVEQRALVDAALKADETGRHSRADQLVMLGRASAASGDFQLSAAAYTMFLEESGDAYPYSARIAARLVDSLAPLDLQAVDILHGPDGPRYEPRWRMNAAPTFDQLRQAVFACEYAARLASEPQTRGAILLKAGWIQRSLGDWPASTKAFERCTAEAPGAPAARDALRLAAENLRWTGHPAEAAELLRRLQRGASERAAQGLAEEIDALDAEAMRDERWLSDPVAGLQAEIERRDDRSPEQVFREALNWLAQRGEQSARLAVARWGMAQGDWSQETQLVAHLHAADALLASSSPSTETKAEAADVLGQVIEFAPNDSWLISTAMRRSVLLRAVSAADQAAAMWAVVSEKLQRPGAWSAQVLPERIKASMGAADHATAEQLFEELERTNPEHPEIGSLRAMLDIQEEGK